MKNRTLPIAFAIWLIACASFTSLTAAGLVWDNLAVDVVVEPVARVAKAEFPFRNAANFPVTIAAIEPSCQCTVAELTKKTYAPGERGVLPVSFTFGDQRGRQQKEVVVRTNEPGAEPFHLVLRANITELATLEPGWAVWHVGDEPKEKAIVCQAMTEQSIAVVEVATEGAFVARVENVENGRTYRVHLEPKTTRAPVSAVVQVKIIVAGAGERTYRAFVAVR